MSGLNSKIISQTIDDLKKAELNLKTQMENLKIEIDQTEGEEKIGLYNDLKTIESAKKSIDDALGELEHLF